MKFKTTIERDGAMCFMKLPFDVKAKFGKARPPVLVKVNGHEFASTVAVYGGESYLPLRKSNREAAKLEGGELVEVTLTLDEATRTVDVPPDLARALKKDKAAREAWAALSYSHQREHADAIDGAKKAETRASRVEKALAMLKAKKPKARERRG